MEVVTKVQVLFELLLFTFHRFSFQNNVIVNHIDGLQQVIVVDAFAAVIQRTLWCCFVGKKALFPLAVLDAALLH